MQSSQGDRHGWNSLNHYLSIHESILATFSDYFVHSDNLQTRLVDQNTLTIRGRISCTGNLYLDVHKVLEINERDQVRTIWYSYQACIDLDPPQRIFRYDNAHRYIQESHPDAHHKHIFDPSTGAELPGSPEWIGHEGWPTLGEVLAEMYEWHLENGQHLKASR
jgi:hypothetical protein